LGWDIGIINMRVSIIIPSFKRAHLLQWNLLSLAKQKIPFEFETIVLNDGVLDETEQLCSHYKEKLNLKYFFTGQRNLEGELVWRIPGFAINIGVKKSEGDIVLLCCAEMFHINDVVKLITDIYNSPDSDKVIALPKAKDDNGRFLKHIASSDGEFNINEYFTQPPLLNVRFPFLIALKRQEFVDIGGYDEDFTGMDYDDNDFVDRLLENNCHYVETEALAIHLWHPRRSCAPETMVRVEHNSKLYLQRKGVIVRNVGKDWGKV
jgi:glycosyltransferase involved in cell wall biosynthesis